MGELKTILEESVKRSSTLVIKTHSSSLNESYQSDFKALEGSAAIWKTTKNVNIKTPQLVMIENALEKFVILKKATFSVDGVQGAIRYAVNYNSLFAGQDSIQVWSDDVD